MTKLPAEVLLFRLLLLPLLCVRGEGDVSSGASAGADDTADAEADDLRSRTPAERLSLGDPYMSRSAASFFRSSLGERRMLERPSRVEEANFLRNLGEWKKRLDDLDGAGGRGAD